MEKVTYYWFLSCEDNQMLQQHWSLDSRLKLRVKSEVFVSFTKVKCNTVSWKLSWFNGKFRLGSQSSPQEMGQAYLNKQT